VIQYINQPKYLLSRCQRRSLECGALGQCVPHALHPGQQQGAFTDLDKVSPNHKDGVIKSCQLIQD